MDLDAIHFVQEIIINQGFAIFVAVWFMLRLEKKIEKLTSVITHLIERGCEK